MGCSNLDIRHFPDAIVNHKRQTDANIILFSSKNAIFSTPFSPISPQQFPLSQYCVKPNSKKNLTDEKSIFNQ